MPNNRRLSRKTDARLHVATNLDTLSPRGEIFGWIDRVQLPVRATIRAVIYNLSDLAGNDFEKGQLRKRRKRDVDPVGGVCYVDSIK